MEFFNSAVTVLQTLVTDFVNVSDGNHMSISSLINYM